MVYFGVINTSFDINHLAKLANLPLTASEKEVFGEQLKDILKYFERLNTVDTANIIPTFNVTGKTNALQADEITPSLSQEESLLNAKNSKNGFFETKGVFDSE